MKNKHWARQPERASKWGIAFLIGVMKLTGPGFVKILVAPVALYYYLTSPGTRKVCKQYLDRVVQEGRAKGIPVNLPGGSGNWLTYLQILSFSRSMVDRIYSWSAGADTVKFKIEGEALLDQVLSDQRQGALFLVSHLGNFDLAIARSGITPDKRFNIVLGTSGSSTYNRFRDKIFDSGQIRFIEPEAIDPVETISLVQKVSAGEVVVIAADRTISTATKNSTTVDFLGSQTKFPAGPYIMAHLLEVPVYCLFAIRTSDGLLIRFELFDQRVTLPRNDRQLAISRYAQRFAARLEQQCFDYPLQWYNFYDFWAYEDTAV